MRAGQTRVELFKHLVDRIGGLLLLKHRKLMDHMTPILQ